MNSPNIYADIGRCDSISHSDPPSSAEGSPACQLLVEVEGIQTANITDMGKQPEGVSIHMEMNLKQRIFLRQSITRVGLTASSSLKEQGPIGPLLTDFYS